MSEKEECPLTNEQVLTLQLAQERLAAVAVMQKLRESEYNSLVQELKAQFSENGRYSVESVNFEKKVIIRTDLAAKE